MRKIQTTLTIFCLLIAGVTQISCSSNDKGAEKNAEAETSNPQPPAKIYQMRDALSGKLVNRDIYADYEGKRVYFCCRNSRSEFQRDPEKYIIKFKELGVTLQDTPVPKE